MPELPDLHNIQLFLDRELSGVAVEEVEGKQPLVIRMPTFDQFSETLRGDTFTGVRRRGKFLLFRFKSGHVLAVNPMLTGRLQYVDPGEKRLAKTCFVLAILASNRAT